jgi:hypothetical protein
MTIYQTIGLIGIALAVVVLFATVAGWIDWSYILALEYVVYERRKLLQQFSQIKALLAQGANHEH